MPAQVMKSKLMQQLGNVSHVVKKRVEEGVDAGFQRLPAGVRGICQVKAVGFHEIPAGKKNAGKYYFLAKGIVTEPQYFQENGSQIKTRGMTTSVIVNCYAEKEEQKVRNVDQITSILLAVGGPNLLTDGCDLEDVAKKIQNRLNNTSAPPIFVHFNTWLGKPGKGKDGKEYPARVNENWGEPVENYEPPEPEDAHGESVAQDETDTGEFNADLEDNLDDLIAKANGDDGDAQKALRDKAKELGATDEELDDEEKYPDWESIANYIRAGGSGDTQEELEPEPEPEPWKPEKGGKCKYKGKAYIIEAVQGRSKTVHLKGVVDKAKKPIAVKWDELTEA